LRDEVKLLIDTGKDLQRTADALLAAENAAHEAYLQAEDAFALECRL
jgi:hypothetical protein